MRAVAAAGLLLTGCFYIDPIVTRPVVKVDVQDASVIYRGGKVVLKASFDDPNAPPGSYDWKIYACMVFDRLSGPDGCDPEPFYTPGTTPDDTVQFSVPAATLSGARLTQGLKVRLEARSDRGALAEGGLAGLPVNDAPPGLDLGASARSFTVGAPIDLFARYSDADNALDDIVLDWEPVSPDPPGTFTLTDLAVPPSSDPPDAMSRTAGKRLIAGEPGIWDVKVTAHYKPGISPGASVPQHTSFTVHPDQPPCLAQWQPIAPPSGTTLPLTAPTVFQVPLVQDDLDAYPPVTDAPEFGTATFAWSILPPGAPRRQTLVGATGNRLDFDPGGFRPGDIVELRVEVFDRHHTAIPCTDDAATCSTTADCLQRQTWRVEVR